MAPLNTMVDNLQSSVSLLITVTLVDPISYTNTSSQVPISSLVGALKEAKAVAPIALQILFNSNLDIILTIMILYFST